MLRFCAKTIVKKSRKFELAHLKKRRRRRRKRRKAALEILRLF